MGEPASLPSAAAGFVLAYVFLVPAAHLLHELGHAAVVLALTDGRATVVLGTDPDRRLRLGRLAVAADAAAPLAGWPATVRTETDLTRWRAVAVSLGGPAATLLAVLATVAALGAVGPGVLRRALLALFWWTVLQLLFTVVPLTYPGWLGPYGGRPSDGRRVLDALRSGPRMDAAR